MTARWALALRLARRLILRAPGRSVLIALLVAVPVVAGTFALVTISTARLSAGEAADRYLGHADAIAQVTSYSKIDAPGSAFGRGQTYNGQPSYMEGPLGPQNRNAGAVDLSALLPPGARLVPSTDNQRPLAVTVGHRTEPVTGVPVDLRDPISANLFSIQSGRAPTDQNEIAVTRPLAHRLHLSPGSSVQVGGLGPMTVTAIVRDPRELSDSEVIAPLSTFGDMASFAPKAYGNPTWLIDFPGTGPAPDLHDALAAHGILYETRHAWENPPPQLRYSSHRIDPQVVAVLGSIVLFGIAEIVLLAGTAFAVGTRRQIRELGLVRATGGDDRDVQRIVLGQGVVLGVLGAAIGVALGVFAVFIFRPLLERLTDTAFGRLDGRPLPILGIALVGVVAALLAALVPARSSGRLPVLDMLRTRFPVASGVVRTPRWALAALVAGPAMVIGAAVAWHHSHAVGGTSAALSVSVRQVVGNFTAPTNDTRWTILISLGAAVTLAGLARSCATLVTRIGAVANRFPLSLRLATRDAARHRHRTAPAAAAVATVVAGAVMTVFVASATDVRNNRSYVPYIPIGTVQLTAPTEAGLAADVQLARSVFPIRSIGGLGIVNPPPHSGDFAQLAGHVPGCHDSPAQNCQSGRVDTADAAALDLIAGRHGPAAATVLARGGVVALQPGFVSDGQVGIDLVTGKRKPHVQTTTLPAIYLPVRYSAGVAELLVSPATAEANGWRTIAHNALIKPAKPVTSKQEDTINNALGPASGLFVERGYQGGLGLPLLILIAATALATLAGTSIAVALSLAESRADMATLAAVGAPPSRRRVQAMAQAATVGGLGSLLGLGLGALVGISLLQGSTSYPLTVPVGWIALLVVAAPLLAVCVAGLATRNRIPMTRRLG